MARRELVLALLAIIVIVIDGNEFSSPRAPLPSRSSSSSPPPPSSFPPPPLGGIKGGYWPSWRGESFPPSQIPTKYFTHLFYAFVVIDPTSYQLSITQIDHNLMGNFTKTIHSKRPKAKALLSIGGGSSSPSDFSNMASNSENRAGFIKSTIDVAREYGFDGLDLDWEFPQNPQEMSSFAALFRDWRAAVDEEARSSKKPRLLLSAAVYFASEFFLSDVRRTYPGDAIREYVDFVNLMCYDYRGSWDTSSTGAHALLYDNTSNISTSHGTSLWIQEGVPPTKLVMGLPMYGKSWQLRDPNVNGIGAPAVGVGSGDVGIMLYKDIVEYNKANNATVVYDNETVSTYSYAGSNWIGYDGPVSIWNKVRFAKAHGLGGYFFWAVGYDKDSTLSRTASWAWDTAH